MHFRYLDTLRGLAILGVIVLHSAQFSQQDPKMFMGLPMSGQRGVQLFYVVSAFTLFMSMESRGPREKHATRNFFIRRFFRIAPMYYCAIIANLLWRGLAPRWEAPNGISVLDVVMGFLFLNGVLPHTINAIAVGGWSIAVESSFYLIVPLLYRWINSLQRAVYLLVGSTFFAIALRNILTRRFPEHSEYFGFFWFPIEFPVFCMGIVAYFVWKLLVRENFIRLPHSKKDTGRHVSLRMRRSWSALLLVVAAEIFWFALPTANDRLHWASLAFIPLLLALALQDWSWIVNRFTTFVGKISYSMYLTQFLVLFLLLPLARYIEERSSYHLFGQRLGFFFFAALGQTGTMFVSFITYHLIEAPGMRLGKLLIARWERPSQRGAAGQLYGTLPPLPERADARQF